MKVPGPLKKDLLLLITILDHYAPFRWLGVPTLQASIDDMHGNRLNFVPIHNVQRVVH